MKKRIISILVWAVLTVLYCWNFAETGRSMGANTNSAIESYAEMMVEYGKETDFENLGSALADSWSYNYFDDLAKEFKFDFAVIGVTTSVYMAATILLYHFSVKKENSVRD